MLWGFWLLHRHFPVCAGSVPVTIASEEPLQQAAATQQLQAWAEALSVYATYYGTVCVLMTPACRTPPALFLAAVAPLPYLGEFTDTASARLVLASLRAT